MQAYERFLQYIRRDTSSSEESTSHPSTSSQKAFADELGAALTAWGLTDVQVTAGAYVYATLPGNAPGPTIGLIAHLDTSPDAPGAPMNARVIHAYAGGDIRLSDHRLLRASENPELQALQGQDVIVTDGKTLLGADDKAGVAEIMTLLERLLADPSIRHATIKVAFTPDEEIGIGADAFDVAGFHADFAYTVDGGTLGELEYENFNAAAMEIEITGLNIHPGAAKGKMKNAALMAATFAAMLPPEETPAHTAGYEGFYHLRYLAATEERATLKYLIRDHSRDQFERRKGFAVSLTALMNERYGAGTFTLTIRDTYYNMAEVLKDHPAVVERARTAFIACGVQPLIQPIRGGTDGARLSFMGLPCPNLSTGGHNAHSVFEYIGAQDMEKMVDVLTALIRTEQETEA